MDFGEFFGGMANVGADGKRGAFSRVALFVAALGLCVGGYLGWTLSGSIGQGIGWAFLAAFIGWLLGLMLRGFLVLVPLVLVVVALTFASEWLAEAFA